MRLLLENLMAARSVKLKIGPTPGSAADAPYLSNGNAVGLGTLTILLQPADLFDVMGVAGEDGTTHLL